MNCRQAVKASRTGSTMSRRGALLHDRLRNIASWQVLLVCGLALAQAHVAAAGECKQNVDALETDCFMSAGKTYRQVHTSFFSPLPHAKHAASPSLPSL